MRSLPLARIDANRAPALINHAINAKARRDQGRDTFAFLVDGVTVKESCADAGAPAPPPRKPMAKIVQWFEAEQEREPPTQDGDSEPDGENPRRSP